MKPQDLHAALQRALTDAGPAAGSSPATAWPTFRDTCVPAAKALRAGELFFDWGTQDEPDGRRFYVSFRCANWWVNEPWRDDSECDLWQVELEFTRPSDAASGALRAGNHECLDVDDPDTFAPAVEASGLLPMTESMGGWVIRLTWERLED
ncbi:MAG TPA: hypothetical protein VD997_01835 [Phycisphaerales bacterium]|nr:hypothetical protein [Phycisphaerales bacterium]